MVTRTGEIGGQPRRWLLLVHLLPATPSNLRVRTWRRLVQLGAIAVKQSVYLLPDSPSAREDFEWLKTEIIGAGGEATVFAADSVDTWSDDALVAEFRRLRQAAYADLAGEMDAALKRLNSRTPSAGRGRNRDPRQLVDGYRQRLADIERIDFFGSPGRDRATALLAQFERRTSPASPGATGAGVETPGDRASYRKRVWVTRPRPGVDRMASAWLIRRFIDADATFDFVADAQAAPRRAIPFDMFGVEFSHHGDHCTFETLCARFGVHDPAVHHLAAIVHDLDLKDGKFGPPEAPTVGQIIEGMQLACDADEALLAQGISLFEALFRSLERPARPVAAPARRRARRSKARSR